MLLLCILYKWSYESNGRVMIKLVSEQFLCIFYNLFFYIYIFIYIVFFVIRIDRIIIINVRKLGRISIRRDCLFLIQLCF